MNTQLISGRLFGGPAASLRPTTFRELHRLARALQRSQPLSFTSSVQGGKLHLRVLANRNPGTNLVRWLGAELHREAPAFLQDCVTRQLQTNAQRKAAKLSGSKPPKAPLAGIVVGPRDALYDAFFKVIKAECMRVAQDSALQSGLTVKGLQEYQVGLTPDDFMNPYDLYDGSTAFDPRAELALVALGQLRAQPVRVFQGEEAKTRAEELADKQANFAHSDAELLSESLRAELAAQGALLPSGADPLAITQAVEATGDPTLIAWVAQELSTLDTLADTQRVYVDEFGNAAFTCKRTVFQA